MVLELLACSLRPVDLAPATSSPHLAWFSRFFLCEKCVCGRNATWAAAGVALKVRLHDRGLATVAHVPGGIQVDVGVDVDRMLRVCFCELRSGDSDSDSDSDDTTTDTGSDSTDNDSAPDHLTCNNNHPLQVRKWASSVASDTGECDTCDKAIRRGMWCGTCAICGFDMCRKCQADRNSYI